MNNLTITEIINNLWISDLIDSDTEDQLLSLVENNKSMKKENEKLKEQLYHTRVLVESFIEWQESLPKTRKEQLQRILDNSFFEW